MKPVILFTSLALAALLARPAAAAEASDPLPLAGEATASLLQLQSRGVLASRRAQAATTEQREKAVERFLKTYDRVIPETYYGMSVSTKK